MSTSYVLNLAEIADREFPSHPFASLCERSEIPKLLGEYAAMSQLFHYIQAKALGEVAIRAVTNGQSIDEPIEVTAAVGAFLVSDETGVNYVLHSLGAHQLFRILQTKEYFHSRLLEADALKIVGHKIVPSYSTVTMEYLDCLYRDLSDSDHVARCAAMIAFEQHAERMIQSLWDSIARLCDVNKDSLLYFKVHVGGDDPAEAYHVEMTRRMMDLLVPSGQESAFLNQFHRCYALHIGWCENVVRLSM